MPVTAAAAQCFKNSNNILDFLKAGFLLQTIILQNRLDFLQGQIAFHFNNFTHLDFFAITPCSALLPQQIGYYFLE